MPEIPRNLSRNPIVRGNDRVAFGRIEYPTGAVFGPRLQQDWQVVTVLRGEIDIEIDARAQTIPAGSGVLLRPGHAERFRFSADRPTLHGWCAVAPTLAILAAPSIGRFVVSPALDRLIETALSLDRVAPVAYDHLGLATLTEAVALTGVARSEVDPVQLAIGAYERDVTRAWRIEDLASVALVSSNHLIRLFNVRLGISPMRHLWRYRTELAVTLLRDSGLSLEEIAIRTGFASSFHLSRRVRARTGLSPRAYRAQAWRGEG